MRNRSKPQAAQSGRQRTPLIVEPRHLQLPAREMQREQLPATVRQRHSSLHILRWLVLSVLGMLLLGSGFIATAVFLGWLPASLPEQVQQVPAFNQAEVPNIDGTSLALTDHVAHRYMAALLHKDWAALWPMLHPDAQEAWQTASDFTHFQRAKFGPLKFVTAKEYAVSVHRYWRDPDTTRVYVSVVTMDVSLQATAPKGILSAPSNFALEHGLFNKTLLALVKYHDTWLVLVAGPADLEAPVLVPASPPALKLAVPIFMYHHISKRPVRDLLDYNLTVTTIDFNQQLTWLQQQGYHSISETELFDAFYYGKVLPPRPMILSFDDGYEDMFTDALPVLLAHHDRGVFYIITGKIGGDYMTWEQVKTLSLDGMQIASHTVHHVNVGNPPLGTTTQAELVLSRHTLEEQLGQPVQFFCYPSGEPFHNDTLIQQKVVLTDLFNDGYVGATLDPFSLFSTIQNPQAPYQLNRVRVSGGESLAAFSGILNIALRTR